MHSLPVQVGAVNSHKCENADPPPLPPEESPAVISQLPQKTADAADQLPRPPQMLGTTSRLSEALQMPDNAGSAVPPQRSLVEENRCQALLSWSGAVAKSVEKLRAAAAPQQPTRTGHTFKAVHREHSENACETATSRSTAPAHCTVTGWQSPLE